MLSIHQIFVCYFAIYIVLIQVYLHCMNSLFPEVSLPDSAMPQHGYHTSSENLQRMQACADETERKQVREDIKRQARELVQSLGNHALTRQPQHQMSKFDQSF